MQARGGSHVGEGRAARKQGAGDHRRDEGGDSTPRHLQCAAVVLEVVGSVNPVEAPNGSRLSCGRSARRRKKAEQPMELIGEATQFFPTCARPTASSAC